MISTQVSLFEVLTEVDSDILTELTPAFAQAWLESSQWALDVETYGLKDQDDALNPFKGELRLVQVCLENGLIGVFDIMGMAPGFLKLLKYKMEDNSVVVIHNAVFELLWLGHKYSIVAKNVWDTMIASQILYAGIEPYRHNLKAVALRELGLELNKNEQLSDFGALTLSNSQLNYAANDVRHLLPIATELHSKLIKHGLSDTLEIEMAALLPYADMGLKGFPVDVNRLNDVLAEYTAALDKISNPVKATLGVDSLSNSNELKTALSIYLKADITSTNKTDLSQYTSDPLITELLDSRSLENYVGYLERSRDSVIDGCVRGNFRQCAPKGLGRATSGSDSESTLKKQKGVPGVNLHNPPNPSKGSPTIKALGLTPVRSIFRPPSGQSLLIFDFSAAHARVAAQVTGDKTFIDSYVNNVDCHAIVAAKLSRLVGKDWTRSDISKIRKQKDDDGALATRLRNISKNIFYGWLNGAGKFKTMQTIHAGKLPQATQDDAGEILDLLGDTFTGIKGFHDQTKREIKITKPMPGTSLEYATIRAISGRRVYAPKYAGKGFNDRGGCNPNEAYIANWMMVESDAKKRAMGLIWKKSLQKPEWGMRLCNECHDEIDVLCSTEFQAECAEFCWKAMNGSLAYWVTDLPAYEDEYKLEDCLAESWASK